jgi:hypothetical protein
MDAQAALAPVPVPAIAVEQKQVLEAVLAPALIGCKLDVWKGKAIQTKGGLKKEDLRLNRVGTVVSIRASDAAKRNNNLGNFLFSIDQEKPCPDE